VSATPVVIVTVYVVFTARGFMGVKVATRPAESRETVPATLAPVGSAKVNVAVLIVRGFIALLNVAVIAGVALGQTTVEPGVGVGGVVEEAPSTVGAARGLLGLGAPLSESPHPAITTASRNAGIQILLTFNLRISFSYSTCDTAFLFRFHGSRRLESLNLSSPVSTAIPLECPDPPRTGYEPIDASADLGHGL
jgi:hypothetical protein